MTKKEFLRALADELEPMGVRERDGMIQYYREILADRMEDGLTEEEAVGEMEPVKTIASGILGGEKPLPRKKKTGRGWNISLLIIGSPVWLPILIAFAVTFLTIYMTGWILIGTVGVVAGAFVATVPITVCVLFVLVPHYVASGIFILGVCLCLCAIGGLLVIPMVYLAKWYAIGTVKLGKWMLGKSKKPKEV